MSIALTLCGAGFLSCEMRCSTTLAMKGSWIIRLMDTCGIMINSMIRFAHRVTFLRLVLAVAFYRFEPLPEMLEPVARWRKETRSLPEAQGKALSAIHGRMLVLVVSHMVTGSPVLLSGFVVASVYVVVRGTATQLFQVVAELFSRRLPGLDLLEAQALSIE